MYDVAVPGSMTSAEAARRLGVKLPTLYAYVSRGLLTSHRSSGDRRSLFDADEIEALAQRHTARPGDTRLVTVATSVTELRADGPLYRGVSALELARTSTFEEVAELLWQSRAGAWRPATLPPPPPLHPADRLRWAVVMTGAADPLRSDLRPESVVNAARTIVSSMVEALSPESSQAVPGRRIAQQLAAALAGPVSRDVIGAIEGALVLLADNELASSTVAVRVAASTRADLYDAVLAGLGAMNGALHGGVSQFAHSLLVDAERRGSADALDAALRWQGSVPGFGRLYFYEHGDPRFPVILRFIEPIATPEQRTVIQSVLDLAASRNLDPPTVDFGVAALTYVLGLSDEVGSILFKVARVAGWTAHYLEELGETPLRYRARAIYVSR
jgi:citrate synthase